MVKGILIQTFRNTFNLLNKSIYKKDTGVAQLVE